MMRKNLGYTCIAVLILALGMGASTAMFSVVNAVILKPLPYVRGQELVVLNAQGRKSGLDVLPFSPPEVKDHREQNHSLTDLVESQSMMFTLFTSGSARRVHAGVVSASYFKVFGINPILGRSFAAADERPGALPVLLLSYEFWKEREGGDPQIVGKTFEMNDRSHTVIGVLPPIPNTRSRTIST